jgi:hypothetical protein
LNMANESKNLELNLRLGELTLARPSLHVNIVRSRLFSNTEIKTLEQYASTPFLSGFDGNYLPSAPIVDTLPELTWLKNKIIYVRQQYPHFYTRLDTGYDTYLATFSAKSRSGVRRKVKKFAKETGGELIWKTYRTPSEIDEFYQKAIPLSEQTYQQKMFGAGLPDSSEFRSLMRKLSEDDQLRAYLLFVGEEPVAYLYCPISEGVVKYAYLGFLDEFRSLSPGTVLLWIALESLFVEGIHKIFDFTEGGLADQHNQKKFFSTNSVNCANIFVLKKSFSNTLKISSAVALNQLSGAIGSALGSVGLQTKIRHFIRKLK